MSQFFSTHLSILIPLVLAVGAWLAGKARLTDSRRRLILNAVSLIIVVSMLLVTAHFFLAKEQQLTSVLAVNAINLTVLSLVSFMAVILIKFSERYIRSEKRSHRYWRWLLLSLTSVSVVVLSNNLLLLWLGWVSISLCFHRLLLFYPDRPRAVLAAHKKFILARVAETCLLSAILLLYHQHGTFQLSAMLEYYLSVTPGHELSFTEKVAAFLIAQTALIKCAQLPLHGWLIQVVEAPTPISALLHAGIINLGGFLLISFSPLMALATAAQWTLLIVAGLSTLISALVMMTRISIKVRLAWSTCAQMGLMLIECALGLYELALIHLLTHSLYKAYAFLSTGEAVQDYGLKQLAPQKKVTFESAVICLSLALVATAAIPLFTSYQGPLSVWLLVNAALALYLVSALSHGLSRAGILAVCIATGLVGLYMGAKALLGNLMTDLPTASMFSAMDIWLMIMFLALFTLTVQIRVFPQRKKTQTLYRWLFSGLYLDEIMTRLTLQLWPVVLRPKSRQSITEQQTIEESWV